MEISKKKKEKKKESLETNWVFSLPFPSSFLFLFCEKQADVQIRSSGLLD